MRVLVIAEGVLARAGLAALLADVAEVDVAGQIAPAGGLSDDLETHHPDAVVFDLGYDPARWTVALSTLTTPALLLLPDTASAYSVAAAVPNGPPLALLLREGDPRRLAYALSALDAGLTTLDPILADALLPSGANDDTPVEKLTPREAEVLQLMAAGLTNKAIGLRLEISANTVKYHVNTILSKLGAQSRTEAVVRGSRLGLVML
ncbi:MAG: response regulator transcription factor [Anaerolineae bacterium]|nr:Transcriptional regulatory protein LiaR [Anaerolineae bacterium]MCO6444406.1 response regulator transcription factor [Anaerolineae bacterium]RIK18234.1 MAG: DNA-binding response regulator [Chloroflexota bacterium]